MHHAPAAAEIDRLFEQARAAWAAGQPGNAETLFRQLLARAPEHAEAHHLLGLILAQTGKPEAAMGLLVRAAELAPNRTDIKINCATLCQHLGDGSAALRWLEEARDQGAPQAELYFNLGVVYQGQGGFTEAANAFLEAAERRKGWPEASMSAGNCLLIAGHTERAIAVLSAAHTQFPEHGPLASNALLALNYAATLPVDQLRRAHADWGQHAQLVAAAAPAQEPRRAAHGRPKRLRLAFLSPDLAEHSVAFFLEPLITALPRQRFESFAYSLRLGNDLVANRLQRKFDHWHNCEQWDDTKLAQAIRTARIDVLVDLAGHTRGNRLSLLARRVAPLQISMIGYPGTTGLPTVDYCISDPILDPPSEKGAAYVEQVARLPLFCCYRPPTESLSVGDLPMRTNGHPTVGIFQSLAKISDSTLKSWRSLFVALPETRLILQATGLQNPQARDDLRERLRAAGMPLDQVTLKSPSGFRDFLQAHHDIDLCLDTLPWNGHTTTCHALWMGVPTLTQTGDRRAGRMGKALLESVGLPEFVVDNAEDFGRVGAAILRDRDALAALRQGLRQRLLDSPLCDGAGFTREFTRFIEAAWAQAAAQQQPG